MHSLGTPALAAILAAALSGCTVGPDFKPPVGAPTTRYTAPGEKMPSDARSAAPNQTIALGEKVTGEWWTLFRSPEVDLTVKQAIAGSRTLESAKARLLAARETVTATSGALYPQVNFNASAAREKVSASTFGLTPSEAPLPPNFNLFQVGPTVSYALDIFGGTRRQIEQQAALADYQLYQLDAAYLTLTGNAVTHAIQLAAVRAQLKAVSDILDLGRQNRVCFKVRARLMSEAAACVLSAIRCRHGHTWRA
jgi:outer membrane protein TolC